MPIWSDLHPIRLEHEVITAVMRSSRHLVLVLSLPLAACAYGADAGDAEAPPPVAKDAGAGTTDAAAPFGGQDSGSGPEAPDSGTTNTSGCSFTGTLATFDFSGEPGNQTSTPPSSTATDVSATDLSRATPLTPVTGSNSINSSAWTSSTSIDKTRYYTFKLTPAAGCTLDVGSIAITTQSSSTGPTKGAIATSDDSFGQATSVTSNGTATAQLSVSGASSAVEVRIYGYAASSASGTMRIGSKLTVSGALH